MCTLYKNFRILILRVVMKLVATYMAVFARVCSHWLNIYNFLFFKKCFY